MIGEESSQIEQTITVLSRLRKSLSPEVKTEVNRAKSLALDIYGKFSLIYASNDFFDVVSYRWRTQLAENSKALSSNHVFPELTHNEIVGWEFPQKLLSDFIVICLRDKEDNPRIAKRMDITVSIIKQKASKVIEIWSEGEGLLSRIFSLIYIGDFVSFYLAILNRVEPMPVERITYLKKKLAD
jgi:glucose/mannose-6-phosphate isomerase